MAASNDETDYVHLVTDHLKENSDSVVTHAYNFSSWETNGYDRAEFLNLLDPYLSKDIDLITIQLGENASDLATWESDWMELISYVKEKAPDAEILVIGDFWSRDNRDELKARAAESESVKYVNLDGIKWCELNKVSKPALYSWMRVFRDEEPDLFGGAEVAHAGNSCALRLGEVRFLTIGQVHVDAPKPYLTIRGKGGMRPCWG